MRFFKRIVLLLCTISIFSCEGSTQTLSREFKATLLQEAEIPIEPVKNNGWRIVTDTQDALPRFRKNYRTVYKIRYPHNVDSVSFPSGSEISFEGGSIKGKVTFNDNYLSGSVRLHGSLLNGTITNPQFEVGWACYGDSLHDDAFGINQILRVCKTIHFQRGTYLMDSQYQVPDSYPEKYRKKVLSHIGINQSGVKLMGDDGVCIYTKDTLKTICIYSMPKDLEHSVGDILINGLTFRNVNDGQKFYEFEHTIKVAGVDGLEISNCQFFDFRGDAICLSHLGNGAKVGEVSRNSNVWIIDNYIEGASHNNRNGISLISGKNVLIDGNVIEETSANNMPGSIDIEANGPAYTMEDITITNNTISGSKKAGINISSGAKGAPAYRINVANNTITNCRVGLRFVIRSNNTSSDFMIQQNKIVDCKDPLLFVGTGKSKNWTFHGNVLKGDVIQKIPSKINVDNLKVEE